jgi:O-antigen ligase
MNNYKRHGFIGLMLLWLFTFSSKGALFQLSLYLIPILAISYSSTRQVILQYVKPIILPGSILLLAPIFITSLIALWSRHVPMDKDIFDVFWRLILLPVAITVICLYYKISAKTILFSFIAVAFIHACIGFIEAFFDIPIGRGQWGNRLSGLISNPNSFGLLMISAAIAALHQSVTATERKTKYGYILACCLFVIAWEGSGSRSAGLALSAGILILLAYHYKSLIQLIKTNMLTSTIVLGLIIIGIISFFYSDFFTVRILNNNISTDLRLPIWNYYFNETKHAIWLGRSVNEIEQFQYLGNDYYPHNLYLEILLRSGLIGLTVFLLLIGIMLRKILSSSDEYKPVCLALFIAILINCFFNTSLLGNEMSQGIFTVMLVLYLMQIKIEIKSVVAKY